MPPQPMTPPKGTEGHSMSARASETSDEVSRLDESSLWQMQVRLARWGARLNALEAEILASGGSTPGDDDRIADLKESHRTTCLKFEQLKATGLPLWDAFVEDFQLAWSEFETTASDLKSQRGRRIAKE